MFRFNSLSLVLICDPLARYREQSFSHIYLFQYKGTRLPGHCRKNSQRSFSVKELEVQVGRFYRTGHSCARYVRLSVHLSLTLFCISFSAMYMHQQDCQCAKSSTNPNSFFSSFIIIFINNISINFAIFLFSPKDFFEK